MVMKRFVALVLVMLLLAGCSGQPKHTHDYTKSQQEKTCTRDGGVRYECECGDTYVDVTEKAPGHTYEAEEIPPFGDLPGYTQYKCSVCGDIYQDKFTEDPTGPEQTDPTDPDPTDPDPTDPDPTDPDPTEPDPTEPKPTEPKPTEPDPTVNDSKDVMHFFDDAAFIGDSISLKLQRYQSEYGVFGSATFLTAGSYSVNHAVNNTMLLSYRGQQMKPEDALAACGAKKVFILLGMNDIALVGIDGTIKNWATFIGRIREKNPDIAIYIQSGTPIYATGQRGSLTNANMDAYNQRLKAFAAENGCHYIDVATTMKTADGSLKKAYCSDDYVHLTTAGCDAWVSVLRAYVGG